VSKNAIIANGGQNLYKHMPSLPAALQIAFPNHPWKLERFKENMRRRKWADVKAQREFLELIAPQLGVKQVSRFTSDENCCLISPWKQLKDWFSVSRRDIELLGGRRLFTLYSSLLDALKSIYPELKDAYTDEQMRGLKYNLDDFIIKAEEQLGIQQVRS